MHSPAGNEQVRVLARGLYPLVTLRAHWLIIGSHHARIRSAQGEQVEHLQAPAAPAAREADAAPDRGIINTGIGCGGVEANEAGSRAIRPAAGSQTVS
jgi:hypothetical protein